MAESGSFSNDNGDFVFEVEQWRIEGQDYTTEDVDLDQTGDMIIKVTDEEGNNHYETIILPRESWKDIEDQLEFDWSKEGSRGRAV